MTTKWKLLQQRFLKEHSLTGITVKAWCEKEGLNYATARRHIKLNTKATPSSTRKVRTNEKAEIAQKKLITKSNKYNNQNVSSSCVDKENGKEVNNTITSKKRVASLANQNARTFGHYSEFITTDEDAIRYESASDTTLNDELKLMRMQFSNLLVAIKMIEADLNKDATIAEKTNLYDTYEKLQTVANVKVARIESLDNSVIRQEKIRVDIEKAVALTQKAQLEADNLRQDDSELRKERDEMYEMILAQGGDGMMNTN